jgi:hypothetical protein
MNSFINGKKESFAEAAGRRVRFEIERLADRILIIFVKNDPEP